MTKDITSKPWNILATGTGGTWNSNEPSGYAATQILDPEFIFTDNFEGSEDTSFWGSTTRSAYGVAATQDPGYAGGKVMSMDYQAAPAGSDSFSEKRFKLVNPAVQLEMSWDAYTPSNFIHRSGENPDNNKFWAIFGSGDFSIAGSEVGMISELQRAVSGQLGSYPDLAMGGDGVNFGHTGNFDGSTTRAFFQGDGNFHRYHVYLELAAGPGLFGTFEVWRDGILLLSNQQDLDISAAAMGTPSNEHIPFNSTYNFVDAGYLFGFWNSGVLDATTFYVDNFRCATRSSSIGATI